MEIEINGVYYLFRIIVSIIIVANEMEFDRSCVLFILLTLSLLSDLIISFLILVQKNLRYREMISFVI